MIKDFYNQLVTLTHTTGRDIDGMPQGVDSVEIEARLQDTSNTKVTIDNLGTEVVTNAEMWCSPSHGVAVGDNIEYNGVVYEVITVENKRVGSSSLHHNKARLKRTKEQ